jgi:hypothetical protein
MSELRQKDLILFKRSNGSQQIATVTRQKKENYVHVKWVETKNGMKHYRLKFIRFNEIVHVFSKPKISLMRKFLSLMMKFKPFLSRTLVLYIIFFLLSVSFCFELQNEYKRVIKFYNLFI